MTPLLRRELLQHKLSSKYSNSEHLVFPTIAGTADNRKNVLKRVVHPAAKRANAGLADSAIPRIPEDLTNHDLRRVFSSLLDEVNAPLAYKDQQMGHKAPGLADAYDRPFKRQRDIGKRMDALVLGADADTDPEALDGST